MPTLAHTNIPTPKSWDEFEDIVLTALQIRWLNPDLTRHGRPGQKQNGVDIYGKDDKDLFVGVQCKNTVEGVTETLISKEVQSAKSFVPAITRLIIATTARRDVSIQEYCRTQSKVQAKAGLFSIEALFWEDICHDLATDEEKLFKHYPQLRPRNNSVQESDRGLFNELLQVLSSQGVIEFLRTNNMAGFSFRDENLDPLRKFYYEWNVADKEFLNPQLEQLRKELHIKTDKYLEIIANETWTLGSRMHLRSVPQEWEYEQPERFERVVGALHKLAGEIVDVHQQLVRTARAYFAVQG